MSNYTRNYSFARSDLPLGMMTRPNAESSQSAAPLTRPPTPKLPSTPFATISPGEYVLTDPKRFIASITDIDVFLKSAAFDRYMYLLVRVNEAVKGVGCPIGVPDDASHVIKSLILVLNELEQWLNDIPPEQQAQRFGNKAFRTWMQRLNENADRQLKAIVPEEWHHAVAELKTYWTSSFGNATRIDYGTGHEMNFVAFLCCLSVISLLTSVKDFQYVGTVVFPRLEPAGSHGVWGLDDFQFVVYIWGSAQLIGHPRIKPKSSMNREITSHFKNNFMFLGAIEYIHEMKHGPFHEHSPMLYDISGVQQWQKVNSGLLKMYLDEVLKKVPVVQHFEMGSLLPWRPADSYEISASSENMT